MCLIGGVVWDKGTTSQPALLVWLFCHVLSYVKTTPYEILTHLLIS